MLPYSNEDNSGFQEPSPATLELGEVFSAGFELATYETPVIAAARNAALDDLEKRGKVLSAEEANAKYQVEVPFTKPISELAAFHLSDEYSRKQELNRAIENGPTGSGVMNFAAGALAHMMDPVETGLGILTGVGISKIGAMATKSAIAPVAKFGASLAEPTTVVGTFAREATENFVGAMAAESYVVGTSKRAQMDYGWQQATINSFASGIIGGGLSTITKYGLRSSLGGLSTKSDEATGIALTGTRTQLEADIVPNPEIVEKAWKDSAYGEPPKDVKVGEVRAAYVHKPLTLDQLPNVPLFSPSKMAGTLEGGSRKFGQEFGDGVTITDNPHIANNIAGHPLENSASTVAEIRLADAKLLDLDQPILEIPELADMKIEAQTMREYIDSIRNKIDDGSATDADMDAFTATIKAAGYDGYKLEVTDQAQPFNQIHIFPESANKIQTTKHHPADLNAVPPFSSEATPNRFNKENGLFFDAAAQKEFDEFVMPEAIKMEDVKLAVDENFKTLEKMDSEGFLDAETKQMIEVMKTERTFFEKLPEVVNDFAKCLAGGF